MKSKFNFDDIVERRGTDCVKWDSMDNDDMIPLWVADMDFKAAPCIVDALTKRLQHEVFGYVKTGSDYFNAVSNWFKKWHHADLDPDRMVVVPGVVPALSAIVEAMTDLGDSVIIQPPVYNCFFSTVVNNGRKHIFNYLIKVDLPDGTFTYKIDYNGLEEAASRPEAKLLIFCNPHNPAGRLWTKDEIAKVADICKRNGVQVLADEVHCELTAPGTMYNSFATVSEDAIICVSPSKSFNIAGIQGACICCPDEDALSSVRQSVWKHEIRDVNPFSVVALPAAYSDEGKEWIDALREYIWENYAYLKIYLADNLPQCPVTLLEATYLPWVDMTSLTDDTASLENKLKQHFGVWVNGGEMYGGKGYIRINIACPRALLVKGLERFVKGVRQICSC